MNRKHLAFFTLLALCSCIGRKGEMRIKGEIAGLEEADLFVFSADGGTEGIDTIHIHEGQFDWTTPCAQDEATFQIVWPNYTTTTVFGGSGQVAEITGDAHQLDSVTVKESSDNEEQKSRYREKQKAMQSVPRTLQVGQKMPPYTLKMVSGKTLGSLGLRGHNVLIVFWATWMSSTMDVAVHLREAQNINASDAPTCISYSLDVDRSRLNNIPHFDDAHWETFCDQLAFQSPLVSRLGIRQLPYYLLIGKDGRIKVSTTSWEEVKTKL